MLVTHQLSHMFCPVQSLVNPPLPPLPFLIMRRQEGVGYMMKEEKIHQIIIVISAIDVLLFRVTDDTHCLDWNNHRFDDAIAVASIRLVVPRIVYFASIPSKHLVDLQCLSSCLKAARYISELMKQRLFSQMSNFVVIPSIHFHHVISARL